MVEMEEHRTALLKNQNAFSFPKNEFTKMRKHADKADLGEHQIFDMDAMTWDKPDGTKKLTKEIVATINRLNKGLAPEEQIKVKKASYEKGYYDLKAIIKEGTDHIEQRIFLSRALRDLSEKTKVSLFIHNLEQRGAETPYEVNYLRSFIGGVGSTNVIAETTRDAKGVSYADGNYQSGRVIDYLGDGPSELQLMKKIQERKEAKA